MRNVYTVKQVNAYVKNMFAQDFMLNRIYVKGEVSNLKYHTSGHIYFSLKDESGTIACVMFAGQRSGLSFRMQEGQQVIVLGSVTIYERDGKYQLYAREIVLDGAGLLYERFQQLKNELEEKGYIHYEISNFSKKGFASKHNLNCWNQKEYIGVGSAAHSYTNNVRYSNIDTIEEYVQNYETGNEVDNLIFHEKQNKESKMKEYMLLGLRKIEGIQIKEFKNKFGENPIYLYRKELEKLTKEELIEIDGDYIKLSSKGIDLANLVWEEFV